ncbi:hypothetical protein ACH5RR_013628 [Cinchona calisaya]|uniref:GAG-pre-integrase domain-containing protein n=1 Tax=Cinchona calisaya TaxID=153742 RepID=A0ABD3A0L0_9GENT
MFVGRLKPGIEVHIGEIEAEINCMLENLSWLPNFYCIPYDIRISSSEAYQEGKVNEPDEDWDIQVSFAVEECAFCCTTDQKDELALTTARKNETVDLWHARLGHVSYHKLKIMMMKSMLKGLPQLDVRDDIVCAGEEAKSTLEGKPEVYKEWTSQKPWKQTNEESKVRENSALKLFLQTQDPELIYYGRDSGIVD